jgi:hypothetical protein
MEEMRDTEGANASGVVRNRLGKGLCCVSLLFVLADILQVWFWLIAKLGNQQINRLIRELV